MKVSHRRVFVSHIGLIAYLTCCESALAREECKWTSIPPPKNVTSMESYSGGCKNGVADGEGKYGWYIWGKGNTKVSGTFKNGMLNGPGRIEAPAYSVIGMFLNNKENGPSKFVSASSYAEGEWRDGRFWNTFLLSKTPNDIQQAKQFIEGKRTALCSPDQVQDDPQCTSELRKWVNSVNRPEAKASLPGRKSGSGSIGSIFSSQAGYEGKWMNFKGTIRIELVKNGDSFLLVDTDAKGAKHPASLNKDGTLQVTFPIPIGPTLFSYVKATDTIISSGEEFRRIEK